MKKVLLVMLGLCVICVAANATDTCLHDNTAVITLWKSKNPVSKTSNASDKTWTMTMDYSIMPSNPDAKTIYGLSTCNEIDTNTSGADVQSGDANVYLRSSTIDVGRFCWCQMQRPVSSWWVFYKQYDDESTCASSCARDCVDAISSDKNKFRTAGVYMAIL